MDKPTIILATSNGIGMGHLTRASAIASELKSFANPIIISMASGVVEVPKIAGVRFEYIPGRDRKWMGRHEWDAYLRDRIVALIDETNAKIVSFDGVVPYPGIIGIKSILASYYAVEGNMGAPLTLLCLCRSGVDFRKIGLSPSPSDVVMSWLRLQTCLECIPHPCHMYIQCFSTLICCGWAYGCTLTLLHLCRWRWILGKLGAWLSPSNVVRTWLRLQSPVDCIPHPNHVYTKCISTLI